MCVCGILETRVAVERFPPRNTTESVRGRCVETGPNSPACLHILESIPLPLCCGKIRRSLSAACSDSRLAEATMHRRWLETLSLATAAISLLPCHTACAHAVAHTRGMRGTG